MILSIYHITVLGQSLVKSVSEFLRFFNENWRDNYVGALIMPSDSPMAISHVAQPNPKTISPSPRKKFALSEESHGIYIGH